MWFTDFVIAIVIFLLLLISYYTYTTNISRQDSSVRDDLISDARSVSSSLLLAGFPDDWDNNTVEQIGLTDNQRLSESKLANLKDMPLSNARKLLGTIYDFFIFFENLDGNLTSLGVRCGYGSSDVTVNKTFKKATYYKIADDKLEDEIGEIENELGVTIDQNWLNINDFLGNINDYEVVVIEDPTFNSPQIATVEGFVSNGGTIFLGKRLTVGGSGNILDVAYTRRVSCNFGTGRHWTRLTSKDLFLPLDTGTSYETGTTQECNYISGNINKFAVFNDSTTAIARWDYGNGIAYYVSDYDTTLYELQDKVKEAIKGRMTNCGPSNTVNVTADYNNLIRVDRQTILNSKPVKMVIYLWN